MFDVHCPQHGARVLIWPSGVDAVVNADTGIEVHFHCTCGYRGVWVTGRTAGGTAGELQGAPRLRSDATGR